MASPVDITGEIIAITYPAIGAVPNVYVLVITDDGTVQLIFQGRTTIACMEVGQTIKARIVPLVKKGFRYAYNPQFTLSR